MTDEQFRNELQINAFENQLDGYSFGHPRRSLNFKPILVTFNNSDGTIDREKTLGSTAYTFTDEQKTVLLEREGAR